VDLTQINGLNPFGCFQRRVPISRSMLLAASLLAFPLAGAMAQHEAARVLSYHLEQAMDVIISAISPAEEIFADLLFVQPVFRVALIDWRLSFRIIKYTKCLSQVFNVDKSSIV
jgi:hypothetical protein